METNQKKNKKLLIIIGAIVILCVLAVAIIIATGNSGGKKMSEQLNLGEKYLSELDYESAIAAYEAAIKIDPKAEEAYLGLAEVYVAMGEPEKALEVLQKGYEETEADAIKEREEEIRQEQDVENAENNENLTTGNNGSGSETERPNIPNTDMSEAEKKFFNGIAYGEKLLENATDIPYVTSPTGEDWIITAYIYCDKNDVKKYVALQIDIGEESSLYVTTYEVYSQWTESYKVWISNTEGDSYNKYWMYLILNPFVFLSDGTQVSPDEFPGWDWSFE